MNPINSNVISKFGLCIVITLASCATKKSLFSYSNDNPNIRGKIKSVDEKGYEAVVNGTTVSLGQRKRQFDFEDDVKRIYDSSGHLVYEVYTKSNDSIHFEMTYSYFENYTVFQSRKYKQDTAFSPYSKKYFNKKYLITEFLEPFGYKTYFWKSKYNRKEQLKLSYVYENNSQTREINLDSKEIVKYSKQTIAATTYNPDKSVWAFLKRTLNSNNGDSTMFISFPKQNETKNYRYIYEYDNNNNWTKQIQYINDTAKFVIIRELKYY